MNSVENREISTKCLDKAHSPHRPGRFVIGLNYDKHSALLHNPECESLLVKHHGNRREGKHTDFLLSCCYIRIMNFCKCLKNAAVTARIFSFTRSSVYAARGTFTLQQEGF